MKLAIMQPYFFPYIGYFQLINAVDRFVFFDDVNFIKKGWINRNRILLNGEAHTFTIPLVKASQNKLIKDIFLADFENWRKGFLQKMEHAYKKAPQYDSVVELLNELLFEKEYDTISDLAMASIVRTCEYLNLRTEFATSSQLDYERIDTYGQQKILSICDKLNATHYINPANGRELYDKNIFAAQNMELSFLEANNIEYAQFDKNGHISNLSMIDVLMFNSQQQIIQFLAN